MFNRNENIEEDLQEQWYWVRKNPRRRFFKNKIEALEVETTKD